ncbi:TaqI-like C-terminal specificity domain-containing protein [uncultured Cetobacterium sp.]|uniref:Eco57I restriction-modification methylase domain-containing protein n=1 Tax=uncultured Cetobacterium sp. TaxID=527638 RepID=UPI002637CFFB|nr:TaqI-like C-terminal specificity domain-containing protein [uncultured Cetobacterium sp.]
MKVDYNYKIYTPEQYAVSMAKIAIEKYLNSFPKEEIDNIKVADISCGSGNLLLAILEELLKISKEIYGEYRYKKSWITGFDIDETALELFEKRAKSLFIEYKIEGELNIKRCDSLCEAMEEKYDIVLGNPPYLGEKNHKEIFQNIKETNFGKKYYQPKMDYFYFFIEKGIDILKENGILVYLTTNYWLKADGAENLRGKLKKEGEFFRIENYTYSIFKNAKGQHNVIFSWIKSGDEKIIEIIEDENRYSIYQDNIFTKEHNKIVLIPPVWKESIDSIRDRGNFNLGDLVNVNQGIVSGADKVFVFKEYDEKFKDYLKPFYKNRDIGKYSVTEVPPFWIMYLNGKMELSSTTFDYLDEFKQLLSKRREVVHERINWWELQWARDEEIFIKPKIVVRQRCKTNNFAYTEREFYGSADIYYLTGKTPDINLFYLLGYLNSEAFFYWFNYIGKKKGKNLEFYSTPLKESPIYYPKDESELLYIEGLVKKQLENYQEEIQKEIDSYFNNKLGINIKRLTQK